MNWKGFKFYFKGFFFLVLERKKKKELLTKPRYYIFDVKSKTYGSSLYPLNENSFIFDLRLSGDTKNYEITFNENGTYQISEFTEEGLEVKKF